MDAANLQSTPFTLAKQAEDAIDRLWDEGKINDDVIDEWKNEHMRTPYKQ